MSRPAGMDQAGPTMWLGLVGEATAIRVGRTIAVITMVASLATVVIFVALGEFEEWYDEWGVHNAVGGFLFGAVLFVAVPRRPHNGAVWALGWSGLFQAIPQALASAVTTWLVVNRFGADALDSYRTFEDLPGEIMFVAWLGNWSWIPALGLMFTFALLLSPDGRLPSPRWRWVGWLAALGLVGGTLGTMRYELLEPEINSGGFSTMAKAFLPLVGLSALGSVVSLFARYRTASGVEKHQLRWVAYGASFFTLSSIATFVVDASGIGPDASVNLPTTLMTLPLLVGAYAVALLKYRLYDIDVIVSKSVMYLGLLAAITAVYAAVVVLPLLVIGASDGEGPGLLLPILATGAVAVLFEPIRSRMQRWANRLVYGDRATPHEVLSQVTSRLADAEGQSTDDLARLVAQGTGAEKTAVWIEAGGRLRPVGQWSEDGSEPELPGTDERSALVEVHHEADLLGAVSLTKPSNDPITPADRELLGAVAAGAGLVLRNIRLNQELEDRAVEVRESRRRLIEAQDRERHRLERDLHDGAQQQVVALKVKLGIAKTIAQREGADDIAAGVIGLADDTQDAVDALRRVAHGIYPPLLESEGLEPALTAVGRSSSLPFELDAGGLDRYGRAAEETVFFCVTEILERARMSGATNARVGVAGRNGDLITEIDLGQLDTELDLRSVADRLDAAGGTLTIEDQPERGRCVVGSLPIAHREGAKQ